MPNITVPAYLKAGDTIGIVCPSGYMPRQDADSCIATLKSWGFKVLVGKTVGLQQSYFAGSDADRCEDLQYMLDDPTIKMILFGRGGYGLSRIIDRLNFDKFLCSPKWLSGFSDITVLHAHLNRVCQVASLHSCMSRAFSDPSVDYRLSVSSLYDAFTGVKASYQSPFVFAGNPGEAEGELIGGNLSLIAHLVGSRSAYETKGKIIFIEDVGEYLYNVDRMLIQLCRSGFFQQAAGVIIGGFTEMKDTTLPFGSNTFEMIAANLKGLNCPIGYGFPVSHGGLNYALKVGLPYHLRVDQAGVQLKEC